MLYFTAFAILFGLLPIAFYWVLKPKLDKKINGIVPFLYIVFIASVYEFVGTLLLKINAGNWIITYKILAFFSISYFFYFLLGKKYKTIFSLFIITFLVIFFITFNDWDSKNFLVVNSYLATHLTAFVLFFSIIWTKKVVENKTPFDYNFYFVFGLVLYYTGTIFLFLIANELYKISKVDYQLYWLFNIFFNLVLRTSLIIGIWKAKRN